MKRRRRIACLVSGLALVAVVSTAAADDRSLDERCRAEVVELHRFLEEWSNAELPPSDEAFARFADVIAESFLIIDPDGSRVGRDPIVDAIRAAHGRWREAPGGIRIENYQLHHAAGGLALATYEEWHDLGEPRGRLSTVLFGPKKGTPNGLEWLHLHEVWIEPAEPAESNDFEG